MNTSLSETPVPEYYRFSQQSKRKEHEQYTLVKRKLLDACSHPRCSYADRLLIKSVISSQFRAAHPPNGYILVYDTEWPTIGRAVRDFPDETTGPNITPEYTILQQARQRGSGHIR